MKIRFPLVVIRKMSICSKRALFPLIMRKPALDKNEFKKSICITYSYKRKKAAW